MPFWGHFFEPQPYCVLVSLGPILLPWQVKHPRAASVRWQEPAATKKHQGDLVGEAHGLRIVFLALSNLYLMFMCFLLSSPAQASFEQPVFHFIATSKSTRTRRCSERISKRKDLWKEGELARATWTASDFLDTIDGVPFMSL